MGVHPSDWQYAMPRSVWNPYSPMHSDPPLTPKALPQINLHLNLVFRLTSLAPTAHRFLDLP
ncbi:MAG: hypothetical protein CM15mP103_00010 [Gammaproteobacteria bacterium]|nr:MAG: hypothetical protein CM15mP103_00010 [Gammaproteobacteria bacterium]